ncbi:oligosaccharide translocation protein rft1 [Diaporthe amygdali]|uniref:oligosaccharide translocation protein rft1 n=1 Tax=Phomopsis amygdali TaxID=1214568 RepID=UPI0022FDB393|nr:oligosaccharide translocation protein rft1 [Diaporthe amygdali]KAJ0119040.1 oligosaccharide translocation protein rft1 [Diaporthe amygdali]
MAGDDGETKVVRGASLLILLQVFSRAVTFVANQLLLRFMTASLLGVSTQLEVYYLSVLFFARESLRVAIQRQGSVSSDRSSPTKDAKQQQKDGKQHTQAQETQAVVNLGYIAIILGIAVAAMLGWMYLGSIPTATLLTTPYLVPSVYIYALASVLELLSEPAFVVMQVRLQFGARASAEGVATFGKCAVTLMSAVWASRNGLELGVLPFALGQVAYGSGLLVTYTWYGSGLAKREGFSLLPRRLGEGTEYILSYFYQPTIKLASSMMIQSFVKHILTQGDTFLVSALSTPTAQGVYALANNYGGLAARLVFQPVEESSRNYYSRLLSSDSEPAPSGVTEKQVSDKDEGANSQGTSKPSKTALTQASDDLTSLLRFYTFVSVPLLALGPTAAPLVLSLIAGPQWTASGAGEALAAYVYYIPLLAINGLAEGFVASVATEAQVHLQSAWMTAFSVLFGVSGYVFLSVLDWGAVGLVWANGINMAGRIVWAVWFIRRYFAQRGARWEVTALLPNSLAVLAAAVASQVVRRVVNSESAGAGVKAVLGELVKVAATAVPFVAVLAFAERRFLIQCYQAVRGGKPQASKPK